MLSSQPPTRSAAIGRDIHLWHQPAEPWRILSPPRSLSLYRKGKVRPWYRRNVVDCREQTVTSPETEQFTFEAVLLLALLANFHKSDAGKLNPYLRCIRETETEDENFMRMTCWAANFAASAVVKSVRAH